MEKKTETSLAFYSVLNSKTKYDGTTWSHYNLNAIEKIAGFVFVTYIYIYIYMTRKRRQRCEFGWMRSSSPFKASSRNPSSLRSNRREEEVRASTTMIRCTRGVVVGSEEEGVAFEACSVRSSEAVVPGDTARGDQATISTRIFFLPIKYSFNL
jgi:hypothetical protein